MSTDEQALRALNMSIGDAENRGHRGRLARLLAPRLAFQRADKRATVDDHVAFLQKVEKGGLRVTQVLDPILIYGNRAVVECIVAVGENRYHNLRLFVKRGGAWKLLGWANEVVKD